MNGSRLVNSQARFAACANVTYAEGAELRSLTDYNNAIAKLKLAEGTLLQTYNVKIEAVTKEAIPWWAKF